MTQAQEDFVTPQPAATVVVVRQDCDGPEVFMVKRRARGAFASMYVFPGGVLEPDDDCADSFCDGITAQQANANLDLHSGALCYYSAAFREVLEETGILLAHGERSSNIDTAAARDGLNDGSLRWVDFLEQHELRLPCDQLYYISYWVTPRSEPRRFSTRFFLAIVPEGQSARHDGAELTDSCWMRPAEVLKAGSERDMILPRPTRTTLRHIAEFEDVDGVVQWARSRLESGIAQQLPAFVTVNGKNMVVMPGSPYYPEDFDR
ncbi:MAG: NUDIX domain-containing protein [Gammaproteobacteria bacterium]|nr:NUDIX domain-containing protein [Gammaproteobacteria bacterium]